MGRFTHDGLANIQSIAHSDSERETGELCIAMFKFVQDRSGSSCNTLAKELLVEGSTWSSRLVKLCKVVEKGLETTEWPNK